MHILKKAVTLIILMTALMALTSLTMAQNQPPQATGKLGDKATSLEGLEYIKGDKVELGKGDKIYVVEFWATWCPPCRVSIPHLTKIQKKYGDKITVIGISNEDKETVEPFVKEKGDEMNYTVAIDPGQKITQAYMGAFDVTGIPHAFIVDSSGKIIWHDHPMAQLDKNLQAVIDGTYDLEAAKEKMRVRKELMPQYFRLVMTEGNPDEARKVGMEIVEGSSDEPDMLNRFAWFILTNEDIKTRNLDVALTAARQAYEITRDEEENKAPVMDTYALALFQNGKVDEAIAMEKNAIEKTDNADMKAEFEARLKEFEAAKE